MNEIQGVGQIQPSQFFTAEDLAEMFGHVHVGTITRWWKSGYLPTPTKIGRRNLWSNVVIAKWLGSLPHEDVGRTHTKTENTPQSVQAGG